MEGTKRMSIIKLRRSSLSFTRYWKYEILDNCDQRGLDVEGFLNYN